MTVVTWTLALALAGAYESQAPQPGDRPTSPPPGATVLFGGKSLDGWVTRRGRPPGWKVAHGYVEVVPGTGDIWTKEKFGPDFQLHVEFWIPPSVGKSGQERGNSGVYLQGRYEVQVLDSFKNETYSLGMCGALYGIIAPGKNASKPPGQWQTYDITFRAPRVDGAGTVVEKGELTVVHNGETVIDRGRFAKPTLGALDEKLGEPGPIRLQEHGDPVRFRNIWIKPLGK
jgi:hypothetical protein